jgi:hypothetical protein
VIVFVTAVETVSAVFTDQFDPLSVVSSILYPVIADDPGYEGAVQDKLTNWFPVVPPTFVGGSGTVGVAIYLK